METITSTANEKVKAVKKLHLKKYRDDAGLCIAEGVNILSDLPATLTVRSFFVSEEIVDAATITARFPQAEVYIVSRAVMTALSETETPSGVLAVIEIPAPREATHNALVLDGVSDSGNLGTIIRTAAGAGYDDVFLINCADPYSGKAVRASMGGVFRVNVVNADYTNIENKLSDYRKICLDMSGTDVFSFKPGNGKIALFLGNEAHGLSEFSKNLADDTLSIPMANGQESLNVAVAAGIAMYVVNRNLQNNQ